MIEVIKERAQIQGTDEWPHFQTILLSMCCQVLEPCLDVKIFNIKEMTPDRLKKLTGQVNRVLEFIFSLKNRKTRPIITLLQRVLEVTSLLEVMHIKLNFDFSQIIGRLP